MSTCNFKAPNGEKSILAMRLEQQFGADVATRLWTVARNNMDQFENLDINGEPTMEEMTEVTKRILSEEKLPEPILQELLTLGITSPKPDAGKTFRHYNFEEIARNVLAPILLYNSSQFLVNSEGFKPKNQEQANAIRDVTNFLKSGPAHSWMMVEGKAGTGKTTVVPEAVANTLNKQDKVMVAALSHAAKKVLCNKMMSRFGGRFNHFKQAHSVAGLLGLRPHFETGEFLPNPDPYAEIPIKTAKVAVIDEASMINEEDLAMIMDVKPPETKIIFLGDSGQLPPIREYRSFMIMLDKYKPHDYQTIKSKMTVLHNSNMGAVDKTTAIAKLVVKLGYADFLSPTFATDHKAVLTERIRQGEESPILPYADLFWNNSHAETPVSNPTADISHDNIVTDKGSLVFADNTAEILNELTALFKQSVAETNPYLVKLIVFRNETRIALNRVLRNRVFGNEAATTEYLNGELIQFDSSFVIDEHTIIHNGTQGQSLTATLMVKDGFKFYRLTMKTDNDQEITVDTLEKASVTRYRAHVDKLFKVGFSLQKGSAERRIAMSTANNAKNRFADIDYSYAITTHKAQGSTYNTVVVSVRDINSVTMISAKAKSRSIYTAMTRASHTVIMVDQTKTDNEAIQEAIALGTKTLKAKNVDAVLPKLMGQVVPGIPAPIQTQATVKVLAGIKGVKEGEAAGLGINVLRKARTHEHYGNPWSHDGFTALKTKTVAEAVQAYRDWLNGNKHPEVKPDQRRWILNQITSGALDGKTLLYYMVHNEPSHADALAEIVNNRNAELNLEIPTHTPASEMEAVREEVHALLLSLPLQLKPLYTKLLYVTILENLRLLDQSIYADHVIKKIQDTKEALERLLPMLPPAGQVFD